jgi:GNAT superfamily N-acetyltransferase
MAGMARVEHAVRPLTADDLRPVAATLARAFDDDPVMSWLQPDERRRRKVLPRFFTAEMRSTFLAAGVSSTTEGHTGAALWSPPGQPRPGLRQLLMLAPAVFGLGRRLPIALQTLALIDKKHPHHVPHYYLGVLGTEPSLQGTGIGSALLQPVLSRCDTEGVAAYLESSKERNVPFYARHGWEVTEEVALPRGGPSLWLMWRDPR